MIQGKIEDTGERRSPHLKWNALLLFGSVSESALIGRSPHLKWNALLLIILHSKLPIHVAVPI